MRKEKSQIQMLPILLNKSIPVNANILLLVDGDMLFVIWRSGFTLDFGFGSIGIFQINA